MARGPDSTIGPREREVFVEELRKGNSMAEAARRADRSARSFQRARQADDSFALEVHDAREDGLDAIEQVVIEIARGVREAKRDQLTAALAILNARRPEFYKHPKHAGAPAKPKPRNLKNLTDEELENLERMLAKTEDGAPRA